MSARRTARKIFHRLSLATGFVFAFGGGLAMAGLLLAPGDSALGRGAASSPMLGFGLWVVATVMMFVVGWLVVRAIGWGVMAALPRHQPDSAAPRETSTGEWTFADSLGPGRRAESTAPDLPVLSDVVGEGTGRDGGASTDDRHSAEEGLIENK